MYNQENKEIETKNLEEKHIYTINNNEADKNQKKANIKRKRNTKKKYHSKYNKYNLNKKIVLENPTIPDPIKKAFPNSLQKCKLFKKKIIGYSNGRHVLNLHLLDIYNLKFGFYSRKEALISIVGLNDSEILNIEQLNKSQIFELSNYTYQELYKGIEQTIKQLDLNCYVSPEKIINAGNVIKNHNGIETYGGKTVRSYLTHISKTAINYNLTDKEKKVCLDIVNKWNAENVEYKHIKSLPFSIFRYKKYVRTDEMDNILVPDIEAKYNLKRILGINTYNVANFNKLSILEATILESYLIEHIRLIAKEYASILINNMIKDLSNSKLKEDVIAASNIDNVVNISDHGHIHDIVDYMEKNTKNILSLENNPEKLLTKEEQQSIIQIEYASIQQNISDITDDLLWISDLGEALNGKNAKYGIIKNIIEIGFVPKINSIDITNYDLSIMDFNAIVESAKNIENSNERKSSINLNVSYCAKELIT